VGEDDTDCQFTLNFEYHNPQNLRSYYGATYVIWKHPGHLTSMKKELGSGTTFLSLWVRASTSAGRLSRSTARTWLSVDSRERCVASD
jgi:hypothetical protein